MEVKRLANGGVASSIGSATGAAANLMIDNGGTLHYSGAGTASTDRLFTIGAGTTGAVISASGTSSGGSDDGSLKLTNAAGVGGDGLNLKLAGANTGANTFNPAMTGAGATVTKQGVGTWTLTGDNTHTGGTSVIGGTLLLGSATTLRAATGILSVNGGILDTTVESTSLGGGVEVLHAASVVGLNGDEAGMASLDGDFTMSAGTLQVDILSPTSFDHFLATDDAQTFSLTGGTIEITVTDPLVYSSTFQLFSGFGGANTVSSMVITGYDTAHYTATVSDTGVLNFTPVPEPTIDMMLVMGVVSQAVVRRRRPRTS